MSIDDKDRPLGAVGAALDVGVVIGNACRAELDAPPWVGPVVQHQVKFPGGVIALTCGGGDRWGGLVVSGTDDDHRHRLLFADVPDQAVAGHLAELADELGVGLEDWRTTPVVQTWLQVVPRADGMAMAIVLVQEDVWWSATALITPSGNLFEPQAVLDQHEHDVVVRGTTLNVALREVRTAIAVFLLSPLPPSWCCCGEV